MTSERPVITAKPRPKPVTLAEFTRLQLLADDHPTGPPNTLAPESGINLATHVAAAMAKARAS
jgi:hypothetical protein